MGRSALTQGAPALICPDTAEVMADDAECGSPGFRRAGRWLPDAGHGGRLLARRARYARAVCARCVDGRQPRVPCWRCCARGRMPDSPSPLPRPHERPGRGASCRARTRTVGTSARVTRSRPTSPRGKRAAAPRPREPRTSRSDCSAASTKASKGSLCTRLTSTGRSRWDDRTAARASSVIRRGQ